MKVSYKLLGIAGWTVLLDDSVGTYDTKPDFSPEYRQQNLEVPLFLSPQMARAPLGNVKTSISVAPVIQYADAATALAALRKAAVGQSNPYNALVGVKFHLKYEQDTEVQYYPNAVLENYAPALQGQSVVHTMTVGTDAGTSVAPST